MCDSLGSRPPSSFPPRCCRSLPLGLLESEGDSSSSGFAAARFSLAAAGDDDVNDSDDDDDGDVNDGDQAVACRQSALAQTAYKADHL